MRCGTACAGVPRRRVPGLDHGRTIVVAVFFEDRDAYRRLLRDPEQDRWYSEQMAPHVTDVRWIDGTGQRAVQRVGPPRILTPAAVG
jgi:hypothetical protein